MLRVTRILHVSPVEGVTHLSPKVICIPQKSSLPSLLCRKLFTQETMNHKLLLRNKYQHHCMNFCESLSHNATHIWGVAGWEVCTLQTYDVYLCLGSVLDSKKIRTQTFDRLRSTLQELTLWQFTTMAEDKMSFGAHYCYSLDQLQISKSRLLSNKSTLSSSKTIPTALSSITILGVEANGAKQNMGIKS